MVQNERVICASTALDEGGDGIRFRVWLDGRAADAFVIRFQGEVRCYLNECGHVPAQLDWLPGKFFDQSKLYLICSVHGALYAPETGRCLGGRCNGKGLKALAVDEAHGVVFLANETVVHG